MLVVAYSAYIREKRRGYYTPLPAQRANRKVSAKPNRRRMRSSAQRRIMLRPTLSSCHPQISRECTPEQRQVRQEATPHRSHRC